jgi:uncharacterized protein (TIGR03437 family)
VITTFVGPPAITAANAVACDNAGNVYVLDTASVHKVSPNGSIATVAGNGTVGFSGDGGPATSAELSYPTALAVDNSGNIYISEGVETFVFTYLPPSGGYGPEGVETPSRVRKVSAATGIITTFAGNGGGGYFGDGGPATSATLLFPGGLAVDAAGNLYIADVGNYRLRVVSPPGIITTAYGGGVDPYSQLHGPTGVATDSAGNIYVADGDSILGLRPAGQSLTVSAIANAASELPGPIAPGEIVVLRGTGLGPMQLTLAGPNSPEASVTFNGIPGNLIYSWAPQLAAVVPNNVGSGPVQIAVQFQNASGAQLQSQIAAEAPGLFTSNAGGVGQAAALNADGTLNLASSPAAPGSVVSLFATGNGITGPTQVTITGQQATVVGSSTPESGLIEINVRIPAGANAGNAQVIVTFGTASTQAGVTIAIAGAE